MKRYKRLNLHIVGAGKLKCDFRPEVGVNVEGSEVIITRNKESAEARAFHGLTRALINNMVQGVKTKYEKKLELHGVGFVVN